MTYKPGTQRARGLGLLDRIITAWLRRYFRPPGIMIFVDLRVWPEAKMEIPIRFPSEADKIFAQASAYRRLPSDERFLILFDLIASGAALLEDSPHREASSRLRRQAEEEWQRIHKEFFARHGG